MIIRARHLVVSAGALVAAVSAVWLVDMWFTATNDHKRGAVMGVAGALLLSVDAFHSLYHKYAYNAVHEEKPSALPQSLLGGVRRKRDEELARFSWLVFTCTVLGAGLLAGGFLVEFQSE